jgi:RNA polymerase sigma factor (sigma-70 family)
MIMTSDGELLRRYTEFHSEEAFAELVQRHLDLVYSAALRQVNGDAHLAQDVAQTVFTDLARKASRLVERPAFTGWLYTSTRFAATKAVRTERRRQHHEQEAHAMQELLQTPVQEPQWETLRPILDAAMHELNETDRETILMRYFEKRPLAFIGESLGLSEDAARKRVDRALDKLRIFLSKRGLTATAALATVISANAVQSAPAGLAATLATASVAGAAGTGTAVIAIKLMTITKLHAALAGAVLLAGIGTPLAIHHYNKLHDENDVLRRQIAELSSVKADNERLAGLVSQASNSPSPAQEQLGELLRLRSEVGILRRQTNEIAQLRRENRALKSSPARVAQNPDVPVDGLPKDSWAFAGYADPESALQSAMWARNSGDAKTYLASVAPGEDEFRKFNGKPEGDVTSELPKELREVTAYKVLDREAVSDDEVILTIFADGIRQQALFRMRRYGNEWKLAGVVKGGNDGKLAKQPPPAQAAN